MKYTKIAIIGAGNVGSTIAYACMFQNIVAEIMLVDINDVVCKGQVIDLSDAIAFSKSSRVVQGTFKQAAQTDIIILCAGAKQKPGEKRTELIDTNKKVMASIFKELGSIKKDAVIVVVTNPLDVLTLYVQEISHHPRHLIFGSGTYLDTQRLCGYVSEKVGVAPESIHAYMIGEHGDSEFPAWSCAHIGGNPLSSFTELTPTVRDKIAQETRNKAYEVIKCKGATYFGIGACVAAICKTIIFDEKTILPLSFFHKEYDVCFSLPAVLSANGIEKFFDLPLNSVENELLLSSIEKIKKDVQQL